MFCVAFLSKHKLALPRVYSEKIAKSRRILSTKNRLERGSTSADFIDLN